MDKILTFTCNNFFEVSFRNLLKNDFEVDILRLDYDNCFIDETTHFLKQIQLASLDYRYRNNMVYSRYDFPFDAELSKRIQHRLFEDDYKCIFLDFRKLNSQAFLLLDFLRFETNLPIVAFIPKNLFTEENIVKLLNYRVNNVITDFNYTNIISTLNKYKTP